MGKRPHRKRLGRPRDGKRGNKDTKYEERKVAEWTARLEAKQKSGSDTSPAPQTAQSARTHAVQPDDDDSGDNESEHSPSEADTRVVIKVLYQLAGSPPEEDWGERDGAIAHIRHTMGSFSSSIPSIQMVRRTLTRLAAGDMNVAASKRGGVGRPRILSRVDDKLRDVQTDTAADSREIYEPEPDVERAMKKRLKELRAKAKYMAGE